MMFAYRKVEIKKFYTLNANGTIHCRKTETLRVKLKHPNILKLANFKFMHIT